MGDRRLTISHMAKDVGISPERVENILHKKLEMFKFFCSTDDTHGAMTLKHLIKSASGWSCYKRM